MTEIPTTLGVGLPGRSVRKASPKIQDPGDHLWPYLVPEVVPEVVLSVGEGSLRHYKSSIHANPFVNYLNAAPCLLYHTSSTYNVSPGPLNK
jgi:hypothetical protein